MNEKYVAIKMLVLQDTMKYNGVILLTYRIEYPEFRTKVYRKAAKKMNRYYASNAHRCERYCRVELYGMAVEQYKYDVENGYPIRAYDAVVEIDVKYNELCIVSLYTDKYEFTGGAHGNTIRTSQTWNMQKCRMVKLCELFRGDIDYKEYILKQVAMQIEQDPSIYFPDWEKLIVQTFNENSFYATYEGIVIYYQQYDIAPYSSGIREFLIPYDAYVINPKYMCL